MTRGTRKILTEAECARAERLYAQYGFTVAAELMRVPSSTMYRLVLRGFVPACRKRRPMPNDFRIVAPGMTIEALCSHYRTTTRLICQWRREAGLGREKSGHASIPIPDGAEATIRQLGTKGAARVLGVHYTTVSRWKRRLGIPLATDKPQRRSIGWADTYFERRA